MSYLITLERSPAYIARLWETDGDGNKLAQVGSAAGWTPDRALDRLNHPPGCTVVDFTVQGEPTERDALTGAIKLAIKHMEQNR